jgi:hypothetical protein
MARSRNGKNRENSTGTALTNRIQSVVWGPTVGKRVSPHVLRYRAAKVSEPDVRPETFAQVTAGSGESGETRAQHGWLCGSIT